MTIIGIIGFLNLPVRWIPNVNPPTVTIQTIYPGANAQLVEKEVTKNIESALSGVDGVEVLSSSSRQGDSEINITFKLGKNMDAAVEDVRSHIESIKAWLPHDIETPSVMKTDPNSQAIMYLSFYNKRMNERELSDYVDKYISPLFETLDGVGSVEIFGKRVSAMYVRLDPEKMAGANVTTDEVTQLLVNASASVPGGQIMGKDRNFSVLTDTSLKSPEQFNNLIVHGNQNQIVRIRDIGFANIEPENSDSAFRANGKPAIALGIVPQSNMNPLDVEKKVKSAFSELEHSLPPGMEAKIIYNQADYIRASINSVYESFGEAILFVWLVIFLFLCSFRATLIPLITIPVCLISTFALLYFMNFSINTITLMAFVLAIGLVVDDAIVMLENINRYIELGMMPMQAALKGSREIVFPIIAMTITLAAVYAPIAFTPGLLGVLFREFTFTLAGAVLISGLVALTLSPMMCSILLKSEQGSSKMRDWQSAIMQRLQMAYDHLLNKALDNRQKIIVALIGIGLVGGIVFHFLPSELAPQEDMNTVFVAMMAPRSASFQYTDSYVKRMEAVYSNIPDIESYLSLGGMASPAHAFQILMLKPPGKRKLSIDELVNTISEQGSAMAGVRVNVFTPPPPLAQIASGQDGDSLGMVLMTSAEYPELQKVSQTVLDDIRKLPGFVHAENSLKWDGEEFEVNIDQERAADLRVSMPTIANTISTLIAGRKLGKVDDQNIFLQIGKTALADPNLFQQLYVRNSDGNMLPLTNMITVTEKTSPDVFKHYSRLRADTINLTRDPQYKLSDAIEALRTIAANDLPDNVRYTFTGEAKSFLDSDSKMSVTFALALIFIYLVLAAQFEAFITPLIILLTVPFALIGAVITLKLFGGTLNIYSDIGLITLIGLIAKHGILITEFANGLRTTGLSIREAVKKAALLRLRPILMTTAAMVLGAMPLAFAFGPGAENRQQIGMVIAGGLLIGTFFSLIVIPIVYTLLAPLSKCELISTVQEIEHAAVL